MKVKTIVTGYLEENCYILEKENSCLIVDPGDDFDKIQKEIIYPVLGVLLTHRHFDHIGALEDVLAYYHCPLYERVHLEETVYNIGPFSFRPLFTPGHSKDSVTYFFFSENSMFCGDFLFYRSIGRCDLEGGNEKEMQESIQKIKQYDGSILLYPGHGRTTTIFSEKRENPYFNF